MLKKLRNFILGRGIMFDVFLSHILVLVIPILLNISIECIIINSVKTSAEKAGFLVVENARNNMDHLISNVEKTIKQINSNENMLPVYQYQIKKDNYGLKKSIDMLKYTCQNADDIEDIFVYNEDSDIVITTSGRGVSDSFFETYYHDTNITYEQWREDVTKIGNGMFRVVYNQELSIVESVEYLYPLTGNQIESYTRADSNFPAVITVRLNMDKFRLSSDVEAEYDDMLLYAVTPDAQIICNGDISNYDAQYILSKYRGDDFDSFEKDGMMYICKASQINNWIYVSSTPIWKYNMSSILSIIIILIGSIIIFVLGIKMILHFVKVNYGGIIHFSDRIKNELNMKRNIKIDEVNKCFEQIFDERNELLKKSVYVEEIQFGASILKLLNDASVRGYSAEFDKIKDYMRSDAFCVVCCQIEDSNRLYADSEYEQLGEEEKREDAYFIARNVLAELLETKYSVIGVPISDKNVFVVGNKKEKELTFEKDVYGIVKEFTEKMSTAFNVACVVSIGDIVCSYDTISKSYHDAINVLQYSIVLRNSSVLIAKEYRKRNDRYKITQYHKEVLSANIMSGNINGTIDVLNELYDINMDEKKLSVEMIKCFLMEILGVYEDICRNKDIDIRENIIFELFGNRRIDDTKKFFEKLTVEICDKINETKQANHEELVEKIKLYIDNFYMDHNINVYAISSAFGLSRAYVSKIFKEYAGDSILESIHKRRIEQAVVLLGEGASVNEVAEKVGYVNSSVFIRTFKKYKGVTPSQFHKI